MMSVLELNETMLNLSERESNERNRMRKVEVIGIVAHVFQEGPDRSHARVEARNREVEPLFRSIAREAEFGHVISLSCWAVGEVFTIRRRSDSRRRSEAA